jgi:hypothetical protein
MFQLALYIVLIYIAAQVGIVVLACVLDLFSIINEATKEPPQ